MNRDRLINTTLLAGFLVLAGFVLLAMAGCATPQGGATATDSEVELEDSHSNTVISIAINMPTMRDATVRDTLKDLFPELKIPGVPSTDGGQIGPQPEPHNPNVLPTPPDDNTDVMPDPGPATLNGNFLWKPESETTGELVILLDSGLTGRTHGVDVTDAEGVHATGEYASIANGNREHYRGFGRPGSQFVSPATVHVSLADGSVLSYIIEDTAARDTGGPL